ncbi:NAD(P)-dependent alcohol dehydrogenase, partial [Calidithermus terrae]|uniref:NAD(P)-dependent alcohol dehydrogenase n=1 Tax=Calidithermus terrae TaxID=1408545 RepID=UPI0011C421C3
MKAMVYTRYGSPDVLELKEVPKPVPKAGEVLVRVHATALNAADWRLLTGTPRLLRLMFGLFRPKHPVLGADVAGRVEAVGKDVKGFKPGDEVFGDLSGSGLGGLAEYVCAKEQALALKPPRLAFEEAAAVPMAAVTALQGLRDAGGIRPGQEVLINGASGGVGTFAVQIAKALGARVTAVCSSQKVDLARSLGADHVVDYAKEDFTKSGRSYDLILDVAAYRPFSEYRPALGPQGVYALVGGHFNRIL